MPSGIDLNELNNLEVVQMSCEMNLELEIELGYIKLGR